MKYRATQYAVTYNLKLENGHQGSTLICKNINEALETILQWKEKYPGAEFRLNPQPQLR
jgi:hypothetical protein